MYYQAKRPTSPPSSIPENTVPASLSAPLSHCLMTAIPFIPNSLAASPLLPLNTQHLLWILLIGHLLPYAIVCCSYSTFDAKVLHLPSSPPACWQGIKLVLNFQIHQQQLGIMMQEFHKGTPFSFFEPFHSGAAHINFSDVTR